MGGALRQSIRNIINFKNILINLLQATKNNAILNVYSRVQQLKYP